MLLIKTNRDTLLKPLQTVTGIVEKKQTKPILSNVLIQNTDQGLSFLTSNMEIQIQTITEALNAVNDHFSFTVSAKKLQDILRSFETDSEVSLIRKGDQLQVISGKSLFYLHILPSEDFPIISEDAQHKFIITLQQKNLKRLLNYVHSAIAEQDIRYYLNGILFSIADDELITVATDTHQLAFAKTEIQCSEESQNIILPRRTVLELIKLLKEDDAPINVEIFPKKIRFIFSDTILLSKVIDGKYPNYQRVIPTQNEKIFELNRLELLYALQRVSILSNESENFRSVRLTISKDKLCIICKNSEQEEATEELFIPYDDTTIDINLNITYLLQILNNVQVETLRFALTSSSGSVLMTIPGRDDFKYVIMPMRI